jgi:hypothetical protein
LCDARNGSRKYRTHVRARGGVYIAGGRHSELHRDLGDAHAALRKGGSDAGFRLRLDPSRRSSRPSRRIGVCYTFPGKDKQPNPIGAEDRATLERLEIAGKFIYLDDDTRRRYEAMKRAGQFGR